MADPTVKDRPAAWPSPWPYDFPVEGKVPAAPDKVARIAGVEPARPVAMTRRSLFGPAFLGWGAFLTAVGIGKLGLVRFLFPNVSFETPQEFPTDKPETFARDTVSETWKETNGVWVANVEDSIIAISTVCTHLGCTPNWLPAESKFKCPCHGSGYYMNGVNFEGPTPRPLERFRVYVGDDGKLWVDKNVKCQVEQGTCADRKFGIPA